MNVFSAHAEVVPYAYQVLPEFFSILRARGGSSAAVKSVPYAGPYSPRTRR